ncbi:MAG: type III pantothenate kinase [Thermoleophilaceae bacterium]
MLLAIDNGNTQTHVGMFRDGQLAEHWRLATVRESTADELAAWLSGLLRLRDLDLSDVEGAIVSSVVPQLEHEYGLVSERYLKGTMLVVGPKVKTGMPIRMDSPHELGADRLMNAVAAYDKHHAACIVVDFGTAINFDVVSGNGEYVGSVLAPGVEISMNALADRAAKLPKVDLEAPADVIGHSTVAALQSGAIYGFAGMVDGVLRRVRAELGEPATAIATGGHAPAIGPYCEEIDELDDLLTLTGLRLVWERNRG